MGLLLLPGALASAAAMPLAAKLMGKVDARVLIVAGGLTLLVGMYMLVGLTPQTSGDDLFLPLVVRAFGTVFMFLPLQIAALGTLPREDVAAGSAFFNLTRQLGGSVGVALLTTLLDARNVFHRAVVSEKVAAGDPETVGRLSAYTQMLVAKGSDIVEAKARALALLARSVDQQVSMMSFADSFWTAFVLVLASLPLLLLLRRPPRGAAASPGAH